jgi:hypothetical protein
LSCGTQCLCACCRFIVQYAAESGGVIVSTDTYRDLLAENPAWKETIEKRLENTVVVPHCIFHVLLTFERPLLAYVNAYTLTHIYTFIYRVIHKPMNHFKN